jgi:glutamate-1-semialdehyde 2,1-aminomutase
VRLARGFTGRPKIITFAGCYHGHSDGLLARAGSGLATFGLPASAGVPASVAAETLVARYNDLESVKQLVGEWGEAVAAVLVEPVAGNMGVVLPQEGFLRGLRALCDEIGALLIFDEVITGYRLAAGGAQSAYGVRPDLTTLGKIIGGGLPLAAFGGRADVMERLAPCGDVYQAGTLAGNPLAVHAGLAVLASLRAAPPYAALARAGQELEEGLCAAAARRGLPVVIRRAGSMLTLYFTEAPVVDQASARAAHARQYAAFFRGMLARGVLLPPSPWESWFLSTRHDRDLTAETVSQAAKVFDTMTP